MSQMRGAGIQCHCGRRVLRRDVLERASHERAFGPSFVYLRFRCPRCRRLGERFVEREEWDEALLCDAPGELTLPERRRLARLGPISADEVVDFHFALEQPGVLRALTRSGADPARDE